MRTIPPELLAAQQQPTHQPFIERVRCSARRWGTLPLEVSPLYAEAATGQKFGACVAPDGAVFRARIASNGDVYVQRVADPLNADAAAWSAWTLLSAGAASPGIAPAVTGAEGSLNLAYVRPDGYTLVRRYSGNNGASWGAESTLHSDSSAFVRAVAAAARPGSTDRLFLWAAGPNTAGAPAVELRYRTIYGGAVGTVTSATVPEFWQVEGLSLHYGLDWLVGIAGQRGDGDRAWGVFLTLMGDGGDAPAGEWATPRAVQRADSASEYRYSTPSLARVAGVYRCAHWARRPGGPDRLEAAHRVSPAFGTTGWTAPAPWSPADGPAVLAALSSGDALLLAERSAWSVTAPSAMLDLADRLLSYRYRERGELELVLSNADGAAGSVELELLRPGAGLELSRGLVTPAGPLAVALPEREVVSVESAAGDGAYIRVRCRDAARALESWRADRSRVWESDTAIAEIFSEVCAYAGLELVFAGNPSAQATRKPAFALAPGESAAEAVRRLLDLVPEELRATGDGLALVDPDASGSAYLYGYGGHPLLEWELEARPVEPNHVQVYGRSGGDPVYGEALDAEAVARAGHRLRKLYDPSVADTTEASGRAEAHLAAARRAAGAGSLRSLPNLALELWDRVEVRTHPDGTPQPRTVAEIEETCNPSRAEWTQTVTF